MDEPRRTPLPVWTVDFGDGSRVREVTLPHAWKQQLPVDEEGPVVYRSPLDVPAGGASLVFHGVSYAADVRIDGETVLRHEGIWDAFAVPLDRFAGRHVQVEVHVVKNGGPKYPVKDVASGFLPFVYHTFGGIHGEVELVEGPVQLDRPAPPTRVRVEGSRIFVDDRPFYPRGLLHWGWYPELGHTNAPDKTIRAKVLAIKELGFNLVKFCLWVPPHRYFEILREEGLEAWLELPLWDPSADPVRQRAIAEELERIVRQYRRHDNIIVWTVGCELSTSTPPEYREYLTNLVRNLTGCPLVKDNSGGAEMYGGDLREFGDFYDFHPYCDTQFYPPVLDSLLPGPRPEMPILLGEFNDIDVHRDLLRTAIEMPYWSSALPELNAQGVRWQYDLPRVLGTSRFAEPSDETAHRELMTSSREKALFMRKRVHEEVRQRDALGGYAITGWRDTPISSAGFLDDWSSVRFSADECQSWNGPDVLFLIPTRRPPWVDGGNRPGFLDSHAFFPGQVFWRVGIHSESGARGGLVWRVVNREGVAVAQGALPACTAEPLRATQVGEISWVCSEPGEYRLEVDFGPARNSWPVWVVPTLDRALDGWTIDDPFGRFAELKPTGGDRLITTRALVPAQGLAFLADEGTLAMPFWRESAYEFIGDFWDRAPFAHRWERLISVSGDRVLDPAWLRTQGEHEVLMNRVDVRTYTEHPVVVKIGEAIVTTLRPFGGLGVQPTSLAKNPAGVELLRSLMAEVGG